MPKHSIDQITAHLSKLILWENDNYLAATEEKERQEAKESVDLLAEANAMLSELQDAGIDDLAAIKRWIQRGRFYKFKFDVPIPPKKMDGVWHCPQCNGRVQRGHTFCHKCGKKMSWV